MNAALLLCRLLLLAAVAWLVRVTAMTDWSAPDFGLADTLYVLCFCVLPALILLICCRFKSATFVAAQAVLVIALLEGLGWGMVEYRKTQAPPVKETFGQGHFWNSTCGRAGYCVSPDVNLNHYSYLGDKLLFNATYTSDEQGLRTTILPPNAHPSKFLLFFGCSFTFGWQLDDNATLPSQVAALACDHHPYNYGVGGYGTANMLARIQQTDFSSHVREPSGSAIYLYMEDHIGRSIGGSHSLQWGKSFPRYTLHGGELVYEGTMWETRPWMNAAVKLLWKSHLARALKLTTPTAITKEHLETVAAMIRESKAALEKNVRLEEFIMALTPGLSAHGEALAAMLQGSGVRVVNLSTLYHRDDAKRMHQAPGDLHPSAQGNALTARTLVEMLDWNCGRAAAQDEVTTP